MVNWMNEMRIVALMYVVTHLSAEGGQVRFRIMWYLGCHIYVYMVWIIGHYRCCEFGNFFLRWCNFYCSQQSIIEVLEVCFVLSLVVLATCPPIAPIEVLNGPCERKTKLGLYVIAKIATSLDRGDNFENKINEQILMSRLLLKLNISIN